MKIHLTSAYAEHNALDTLKEFALLTIENNHLLCDSASDADAIVFVENTQFDDVTFKQLRSHDLVKLHPEKVFMYNEMDRPWNVLPGLFTCMPEHHFDKAQHVAFAYMSTPNPSVNDIFHKNEERRWLYSFMGAMSHPVRRSIMQLSDERGYLKDTSDFNVWHASPAELQARANDYAMVLGGSHFVLCPRGIGTSSIRLYETLEAGRVPVIIGDKWVPPDETDWAFAIRVEENRISSLPELLRAHENEAQARGLAAREAWLENYAPNTIFNTFGDAVEQLAQYRATHDHKSRTFEWNKWMASGALFLRTTKQHLRGLR